MYTQEERDSIMERQRISQLPLDEISSQEVVSTPLGYSYGNGEKAHSHAVIIHFASGKVYGYNGV
jgi:hypothetical protein